ncbi:MAG: hypothetical protein MSH22_10765 [Spirochaetia bacterium]|nr:hypothetical protein [Spirochaetia bacterium]MCI7437057.1 hypothetical protein [Spirochaetia bacterium]
MKAIKFNLSYGNEKIKTLDELKESCNVDMLLETLNNGLLVRWLTAQGRTDLAEKISSIDTGDFRKALSELLKILFDKDASVLEQAAGEIFAIREKEAKRFEKLSNLAGKENEIIAQYHKGYGDLIESLKEAKDDYPALKAQMKTLYSQFRQLLLLDKTRFYNTFKEGYPLVLIAFMANQDLCECFFSSAEEVKQVYDDVMPLLSNDGIIKSIETGLWRNENTVAVKIETQETLEKFKSSNANNSNKCLRIRQSSGRYNHSYVYIDSFDVGDYYLPEEALVLPHIKIFSGKTDQYWKDIEPKGKTFMIISMEEGNKVRNSGANGEEYSASDINGKFQFTDGIDYMSNSDTDKLIYMEI